MGIEPGNNNIELKPKPMTIGLCEVGHCVYIPDEGVSITRIGVVPLDGRGYLFPEKQFREWKPEFRIPVTIIKLTDIFDISDIPDSLQNHTFVSDSGLIYAVPGDTVVTPQCS